MCASCVHTVGEETLVEYLHALLQARGQLSECAKQLGLEPHNTAAASSSSTDRAVRPTPTKQERQAWLKTLTGEARNIHALSNNDVDIARECSLIGPLTSCHDS